MYESYFGLREKPFSIAPDPRFVYLSPAHEEALAHLLYGVNEGGGFVLLTGEVGTGKTTLVRTLHERLPAHVDVSLIFNPKLSPVELVAAICDELGISREPGESSLRGLVDRLNRHLLMTFAQGRRTVLIIDEAQALPPEVLEQIRLLTNLETTREKLLEIILVGQPELRDTLARNELRQLAQRITARYHLDPLGRLEVHRYVLHRLSVAGGRPELFTSGALDALARVSGGIPRLINEIADRCLLGAFAEERQRVTRRLVRRAAAQVLGRPGTATGKIPRWLKVAAVVSVLAAVAVTGIRLARRAGIEWTHWLDLPREAAVERAPVVVTVEVPPLSVSPSGPPPEEPPAGVPEPAPGPSAMSPPGPRPVLQGIEPNLSLLNRPASDTAQPPRVLAGEELGPWLDANASAFWEGGALAELFAVWGAAPGAAADAGCEAPRSDGWHCLVGQGDLQQLSAIDRPVALRLADTRSTVRLVPLVGLTREHAVLRLAGGEYQFPRWAVDASWDGHYLALWQAPVAGDMEVIPGESGGEAVVWARQHLEQVLGRPIAASGPPEVYDADLADAVRLFQRTNGLESDGVLDDATMARIFFAVAPGPRLWRGG